ncbi:hypothetical protein [Fredinandcohnia quinoae]|uniref:Uncharacterized protein n=1 Tax=Fredinandcohnia quinoae TaxID=2918902 RepID=A0AAW5E758_9BACI|nr:hypothetical protein [Fredinandcohnia sp. SECRCQ15]MCH1626749.1 hypothetical protein [Fredinandcohnia sp. SECRCQ15]
MHGTLICWLYSHDKYGMNYKDELEKIAVKAFEDLAKAKNPALRESKFTIFGGGYKAFENFYCVGIDPDLDRKISDDFYENEEEYMEKGYETGGLGQFLNNYFDPMNVEYSTPNVKLFPFMSYSNGKWIKHNVHII